LVVDLVHRGVYRVRLLLAIDLWLEHAGLIEAIIHTLVLGLFVSKRALTVTPFEHIPTSL